MTSQQFLEKFRLKTEVVSSYEAPGLLDEEIFDLLNISQKMITLELCNSGKFDSLYSLLTWDGLLLNPEPIGPFGNNLNVYSGNFTNEFFYPISGQIAVSRVALPTTGFIPKYEFGNTIVGLTQISVENVNKFIENPFNQNTVMLNPVYWIDYQNTQNYAKIKVILDAVTSLGSFINLPSHPNLIFNYIRIPKAISVTDTSDLPENLHELILEKAVEERNKSLVNNSNKN